VVLDRLGTVSQPLIRVSEARGSCTPCHPPTARQIPLQAPGSACGTRSPWNSLQAKNTHSRGYRTPGPPPPGRLTRLSPSIQREGSDLTSVRVVRVNQTLGGQGTPVTGCSQTHTVPQGGRGLWSRVEATLSESAPLTSLLPLLTPGPCSPGPSLPPLPPRPQRVAAPVVGSSVRE
jgi:hypothetical protein